MLEEFPSIECRNFKALEKSTKIWPLAYFNVYPPMEANKDVTGKTVNVAGTSQKSENGQGLLS
jgi:hypothetical protein